MKLFIICVLVLFGYGASAQSIFSAIAKPTNPNDSVVMALRWTGLTALFSYQSNNMPAAGYAGTGISYSRHVFHKGTQTYYIPWGVGLGLYEGGSLAPQTFNAVTAFGAYAAFFNSHLIVGFLYVPAAKIKIQPATGPNGYIIPTN